jgi:HSP20 family protein
MAEVTVEKRPTSGTQRAPERHWRGEGSARPFDFTSSPFGRGERDFLGNPFSLMRHFSDEMDRMFSHSMYRHREEDDWWPNIEVSVRDGVVTVLADLPGLNKDDVKVELSDDGLSIEGERKREHEEQGHGWRRSERTYGSFVRRIPLPEGANADQARAEFTNGVLKITLPVPEQKRARQIPIETGADRRSAGTESAGQTAQSKAKAG